MNKNIVITIGVLVAYLSNISFAQDNFSKIFYEDILVENSGYSCKIDNVVGLATEVKFGLKISNSTSSFMIYKPEESTFNIEGKEIKVTEKSKIINPDKSKSWTINGLVSDMNKIKNFNFIFSGLYKIIESDKAFVIDETKLPLAKNDFTFNNVNCFIIVDEKSTKQTKLKVQIKNKSNQYLIVYPSRVATKVGDSQNLYTCVSKKSEALLIGPNEAEEITIVWERMPGGSKNDMQLRDMFVSWENVFFSGKAELVEKEELTFKWNESLTIEKNK